MKQEIKRYLTCITSFSTSWSPRYNTGLIPATIIIVFRHQWASRITLNTSVTDNKYDFSKILNFLFKIVLIITCQISTTWQLSFPSAPAHSIVSSMRPGYSFLQWDMLRNGTWTWRSSSDTSPPSKTCLKNFEKWLIRQWYPWKSFFRCYFL